jgi:hypothetical protein
VWCNDPSASDPRLQVVASISICGAPARPRHRPPIEYEHEYEYEYDFEDRKIEFADLRRSGI